MNELYLGQKSQIPSFSLFQHKLESSACLTGYLYASMMKMGVEGREEDTRHSLNMHKYALSEHFY